MTFNDCYPNRTAQRAYERTYITNDPWVPLPVAPHDPPGQDQVTQKVSDITYTVYNGDYEKTYITNDSWVPQPVDPHTESTLQGWEEYYEKSDVDNNTIAAAGVASEQQVKQNYNTPELPEYYRGFLVLDENGDEVPKPNYDKYVSRDVCNSIITFVVTPDGRLDPVNDVTLCIEADRDTVISTENRQFVIMLEDGTVLDGFDYPNDYLLTESNQEVQYEDGGFLELGL